MILYLIFAQERQVAEQTAVQVEQQQDQQPVVRLADAPVQSTQQVQEGRPSDVGHSQERRPSDAEARALQRFTFPVLEEGEPEPGSPGVILTLVGSDSSLTGHPVQGSRTNSLVSGIQSVTSCEGSPMSSGAEAAAQSDPQQRDASRNNSVNSTDSNPSRCPLVRVGRMVLPRFSDAGNKENSTP